MSDEAKATAKARAFASIDNVERGLKRSFTDALIAMFWASAAIAAMGLLLTAFVPALPLRSGPPGSRPAAVD